MKGKQRRRERDVEFAAHLWNGVENGSELLESFAEHERNEAEECPDEIDVANLNLHTAILEWSWLWAEDGFFQMTCASHKYAAALMATETSECRGDVLLPARAMRVTVPDGLLHVHNPKRREYRYDCIYLFNGKTRCAMLVSEGSVLDTRMKYEDSTIMLGHTDWEEVLFGRLAEWEDGEDWDEQPWGEQCDANRWDGDIKERVVRLCQRYLIGLLYTLQHTNNFREQSGRAAGARGWRNRPPPHRNVVIGAPIEVDARPQIRRWLERSGRRGKSGPPSVQHVVRGHYKRQVIGIGRSGRKVIWIMPYWRGPEDAPILARPYSLGNSVND